MKHNKVDYGIITAMAIEMEALLPWLSDVEKVEQNNFIFIKGNINNKQVVLCSSSMGQVNAAIATMQMINHFNPVHMIFYGIAGAISPMLNIGDVIVGDMIVPLDIQTLHAFNKINRCTHGLLPASKFIPDQELLNICKKTKLSFYQGIIATSDYFPYPSDLPHLYENSLIQCIDMESSAFCQCCEKMNKPFIVIRAISNVISKDKNFERLSTESIHRASKKAAEMTATLIHYSAQCAVMISTEKNAI